MKLSFVFNPLAAIELQQAVEYYESLAPGKGLELLAMAEAAIDFICSFPDAAERRRSNIRSKVLALPRRWHYTIHYRVKGKTVRVLAFAHHKQQPYYWLGRR